MSTATSIPTLLKELIGDEDGKGPFVSFDPERGEKVDPQELHRQEECRRFEYALLKSPIHGWVEPSESGRNFDLHLTLGLENVPARPGLTLSVQPFNGGQKIKPHRLQPGRWEYCTFQNLGEVELSRFVHFRIETAEGGLQHEFLWRIPIAGLPQDRLDNILRKIIDTRDKFFDYLRFLLADEITKEDLLAGIDDQTSDLHATDDQSEGWHFQLPIYEQLLVAASRSPRKLADVDQVIQHLTRGDQDSECVIPETFLSFWESFRGFIPVQENRRP